MVASVIDQAELSQEQRVVTELMPGIVGTDPSQEHIGFCLAFVLALIQGWS